MQSQGMSGDPVTKRSRVEIWKAAKHGFDVWPEIVRWAQDATPMAQIDTADLERMKWYGYFYRKNHDNDRYMCRVRLPGCAMTADHARTLALRALRVWARGPGCAAVLSRLCRPAGAVRTRPRVAFRERRRRAARMSEGRRRRETPRVLQQANVGREAGDT